MMRLTDIVTCTDATIIGDDVAFDGVAIDTRCCEPGNLFIAVSGEARDGHAFLEDARVRGAAAALVSRPSSIDLPQVLVPNTRKAFAEFASCWRRRMGSPVIAVTGSNGKTTVKQMLAAILRERGSVLATEGNLNNDLGVPITLLSLRESHDFAVIEMGANSPGEIKQLTGIASPQIGIVTNAGDAHLEGFGSLEGVARAKGEMFSTLPAEGVAIMNRDDRWFELWQAIVSARRILTFGMKNTEGVTADFAAGDVECDIASSRFLMRTPDGDIVINLPMPGHHNVLNALAASAAAIAAGASLEDCAAGLAVADNIGGRLQLRERGDGVSIVDDSYNANPTSFQAAFDWLATLNRPAWLAIGDMAELGADAEEAHAKVGRAAKAAGIQRLFASGPLSALAVPAFGDGAQHYADIDDLTSELKAQLHSGVVLLIKGSRRARMERVTAALLDSSTEEIC